MDAINEFASQMNASVVQPALVAMEPLLVAMEPVFDAAKPLTDMLGDNGQMYATVAVILLTTVLLYLVIRGSSSGRDTVLLLGLCDSGKTLLFGLLLARKALPTQTSIQENTGRYITGEQKKSFTVVDLPGHPRTRAQYLYKYKDSARGVIFLVDSYNFAREIRDAAEFLYDLLSNKTIKKNHTNVLVACNKQDLPAAKSQNAIRVQLEKELNTLRETRGAALLSIDDHASSKNEYIGKRGKDFEFSQMHPIKIEFCECSLLKENPQIAEVENWLNKL